MKHLLTQVYILVLRSMLAARWALAILIVLVTIQGATAALSDDVLRAYIWADSSDYTDLSVNANASNSGTAWQAGPYGGWGWRNYSSPDYISIGSLSTSSATMAFCAWAWDANAVAAYHGIFGRTSTDSQDYIAINTGTLNFWRTGGGLGGAGAFGSGVTYHVCVVANGTMDLLYVNGSYVQNATGDSLNLDSATYTLGAFNNAYKWNGLIGATTLWDRALSAAEIAAVYANESAGNIYPWTTSSPSIDVNLSSPTDNDHLNDDPVAFIFNVTSTDGPVNCTLLVDGSGAGTANGLGNVTYQFNSSQNDGAYNWTVRCVGATTSHLPANRTLYVDTVNPDWTLNPDNFFLAANTTVVNALYDGNVTLNVTVDDTYLWAYNVTCRDGGNVSRYSVQATGLTSTSETNTSTLDLASWATGVGTCALYAEDDHTARFIDPYAVTQGTNSLTYVTPTNTITIQSEVANLKGLTTTKLEDRYTFGFEVQAARSEWAFVLQCDQPLSYRGGLYEWPSFVCPGPHGGGNWVDFVPENASGITGTVVTKLSPTKYNVKFLLDGVNKLDFRSLGGLNTVNETYSFNVSRVPKQAENLTSDNETISTINLTWDGYPSTTGYELWRDGAAITNTTNTFYADSGLSEGTSYEYAVFAYYNDTGTIRYNLSSSSENNISATTTFNGTIAVQVRNAVTNSLITDDLFYINLIGTANNQSGSTTTGLYDITNITSDNYTLRVTGTGWGSRDLYVSIVANQSENVTAYLLNDSVRTGGVVTVKSTNGQLLPGAIVKLLRYLPGTNSYANVQMVTTSEKGESPMDAQLYDAYYKWVVEYEGVTEYLSSASENLYPGVSGLWSRTFTIDVGTGYYSSYQAYPNVVRSLVETINNATNATTYTFTWNDPSSLVNEGCLDVEVLSAGRFSTYQETCAEGASGSVFVVMNNTPTTTYKYDAYLDFNTAYSPYSFYSGFTNKNPLYNFGTAGAFLGVILFTGLVLLFSYSAVAVLIVSVIGVVALSVTGLFPFGMTFVMGLGLTIVGMIVYFMRT